MPNYTLTINNQTHTVEAEPHMPFIIYDAPQGYTPKELDNSKVIHRFKTPAKTNRNYVESFTIDIANIKTSSANIHIKWVNTIIDIPLEVNADEMAMANIENMINGPSADNLFQAAEYYFLNNKDLDVALDWAKQSGEKYTWDAYWPHYLQAKILAKKGRFSEAIKVGTRASQYVRKAGYLTMADKIDHKLKSWKAQSK